MQTKANLQDLFLLRARRDKLPVTMFLMNGFQMRGTIAGFDAFVVVLDSDGRQQIIYKHAISTIAPVRPVDLEGEERRALPAVPGEMRTGGQKIISSTRPPPSRRCVRRWSWRLWRSAPPQRVLHGAGKASRTETKR